jgi:hypothetical protein
MYLRLGETYTYRICIENCLGKRLLEVLRRISIKMDPRKLYLGV